jgi:hypothetical protein
MLIDPTSADNGSVANLCSSQDRCNDSGVKEQGYKNDNEQPKLYKSRVDTDGSVHTNLFSNQYMRWLDFYTLEVVVHTLRLLFQKTEMELTPNSPFFIRKHPHPLRLKTGMHKSKGPRKTMEDRLFGEDVRVIPIRYVPSCTNNISNPVLDLRENCEINDVYNNSSKCNQMNMYNDTTENNIFDTFDVAHSIRSICW